MSSVESFSASLFTASFFRKGASPISPAKSISIFSAILLFKAYIKNPA